MAEVGPYNASAAILWIQRAASLLNQETEAAALYKAEYLDS